MPPFLTPLFTAAASYLAWLRAHLAYAGIAVLVLAGGAALRACYAGQQVTQLLHQRPPVLSRRQTKLAAARAQANLATAKQATTRGDSAAWAVADQERGLPAQNRHLTRLLTRYHATSAASLPAAAVHQFLATYRPRPDSL